MYYSSIISFGEWVFLAQFDILTLWQKKNILMFLTALLSDGDLIRTLTGQAVREKEDALLDGYNLVVQRLDKIPESVQNYSWVMGDNFESYNLAQ